MCASTVILSGNMELDPFAMKDKELKWMVQRWELDAEMDTACWTVSTSAPIIGPYPRH